MTKKAKEKEKMPAGPYINHHNWPTHMLCHLGTEILLPAEQHTCHSVSKG